MLTKTENPNETLEIEIKTLTGKICIIVLSKKSSKSPLDQIYEQLVAKRELKENEIDKYMIFDLQLFGGSLNLKHATTFEDLVAAFEKRKPTHRIFGLRLSPGLREEITKNANKLSFYSVSIINLYLQMFDICDRDRGLKNYAKGAEETFLSTVFTLLYDQTEREAFLLGDREYLFQNEDLRTLVTSFLLSNSELKLEKDFAIEQKRHMRRNFSMFIEKLLKDVTNIAVKEKEEGSIISRTEDVISRKLKPQELILTQTKAVGLLQIVNGEREQYASLETPMEEVLPGLYLGNQIAHETIFDLIQRNESSFTFNLDCGSQKKDNDAKTTGYLAIPLADTPDVFISPETFSRGIDAIEKGLKTGNVLVNCQAGTARSASMVVAYIIKHFSTEEIRQKSAKELVDTAVAVVRKKRKCAFVGQQEKALIIFAESIKAIELSKFEQNEVRAIIGELKALDNTRDVHLTPGEREAVQRLINTANAVLGNNYQEESLLKNDDVDVLLSNPRISPIINFFALAFQKIMDFAAETLHVNFQFCPSVLN
ncbi:Dual specificity phosphatase, catalytic domain [Legionella steigerwaltii]|uniref:Dual specificity phosphatase, catalytic domain n=1 Tax=Legionella steigerwaltii TaxID=460 RepID=A0A378L915_9GAMM|nr:dual specificity protein phosphatase [Legionella steigerwaltii]KTD81104.1 hypothetical protein Lstg_0331 [Legionella steigerwaltii]STY23207.1 Dual specificity phosphatase, catalytic domain [Legionella steigerwaltii]